MAKMVEHQKELHARLEEGLAKYSEAGGGTGANDRPPYQWIRRAIPHQHHKKCKQE
jgi:hypothetical protein